MLTARILSWMFIHISVNIIILESFTTQIPIIHQTEMDNYTVWAAFLPVAQSLHCLIFLLEKRKYVLEYQPGTDAHPLPKTLPEGTCYSKHWKLELSLNKGHICENKKQNKIQDIIFKLLPQTESVCSFSYYIFGSRQVRTASNLNCMLIATLYHVITTGVVICITAG